MAGLRCSLGILELREGGESQPTYVCYSRSLVAANCVDVQLSQMCMNTVHIVDEENLIHAPAVAPLAVAISHDAFFPEDNVQRSSVPSASRLASSCLQLCSPFTPYGRGRMGKTIPS